MCWIVVELFNKTDGIFEDLSPVRKKDKCKNLFTRQYKVFSKRGT